MNSSTATCAARVAPSAAAIQFSILVGATVWLNLVFLSIAGTVNLGIIDLHLLQALMMSVPLALLLFRRISGVPATLRLLETASWIHLPAVLCATLALPPSTKAQTASRLPISLAAS